MERQTLTHPFEPVWTPQSDILILGTFPSVASRENQFYYGHKRNRFWNILAAVYDEPIPQTTDEKKALLINHKIAVWDILRSCGIAGSSDASIRPQEINDIAGLTAKSNIARILLNGKKAYALYDRYCHITHIPAICLPSSSPANAAWTLTRLIAAWKSALH